MKMKKYLFLLVAVASLGLTTGCDDDDDRTVPVPDAVADTFGGMYPNASDVEWTGRNGYLIGCQGRKYGHAGLVHSRRRLADD